ncbi:MULTISPECIES: MogA/MoaB family molybdenum cofactor biosynthesis protein [Natronorubrum]|uniref:Molybdenum cofactor synthesis domain-containing protein n=2 Tax=Natronorubrum bangense TaxID=61858 RepID=L9WMB6_9EURY|nr:molybdenum cofactor biosynthesis protein B [Natronorubrum bangense]ELY50625.1 molybdenum cofactor synthesis domain-containing protein [Natronorubrum bangense JCM 10635]QCC54475.1 molybdenum cofactor biosynthesis protein MoaB [Natronorubrum bangense]
MTVDRDDRRTTDDHGHDIINPLYVAIVTVSSSRAQAAEDDPDDPGGDTIQACFEAEGHEVHERVLVRDDYSAIRTAVRGLVARRDIDIVLTTGGTGVTADDVSPEATQSLFERELPGFGELFRSLSWDEVGTRAMASRATAGIAVDTPVFCLPGSTNACQTACEKLIVPEAPHLAGLATRHRQAGTDQSLSDYQSDE